MADREQHDGSNGSISGDQIDKYLREIDKADDKLIDLKVEHMDACKGPRGKIRNIMKEARESGVNMPALRTIVAKHRAERKIEQRISELEADDAADYESMLEALGTFGETELGQAALGKAKRKPKTKKKDGGDTLDTLRA